MNVYLMIGTDIVLMLLFFVFVTFYMKERVAHYLEVQWKQTRGVEGEVPDVLLRQARHKKHEPVIPWKEESEASTILASLQKKMQEPVVPASRAARTAMEVRKLQDKGLSKVQVAGRLGISTGEVELLLAMSDLQKVA
jgi:hypothetical protein